MVPGLPKLTLALFQSNVIAGLIDIGTLKGLIEFDFLYLLKQKLSEFMTLVDARLGELLTISQVGGRGGFRRRLLELGLLPGTPVTVKSVAPLGDPIELLVRGASLSIRKEEAATVTVTLEPAQYPPRSGRQ